MRGTIEGEGDGGTPSRGPVGLRFPSVEGTALTGRLVRLPEDLWGAPALLLVAYRRGAQRDVDLWAAFVRLEAPGLRILEVPVIPAPIWRPFRGMIDGGMRGGVPRPQWSSVVTVYDDGVAVREFVGDRGAPIAYATLLDAGGVVRELEAGGFSEDAGRRLLEALATLTRS